MEASRTSLVGVLIALALPAAAAFDRIPERDPRRIDTSPASERMRVLNTADPGELAGAARAFVDRNGGTWTFIVDLRTERLGLAQGSGVPLIPGRGNDLVWTPGDNRQTDANATPYTLDAIEPRVRRFLAGQRALTGPFRGHLELDRDASQIREGGRVISVYYDWIVDGVPIEGATVFARLNSGNVTQFGSRRIGRIDTTTTAALDANDALAALLNATHDSERARLVGEPALWLQPEDAGDTLRFRLIWKLRYSVFGRIETWEGRVDATTGEVVGFRDTNMYAKVVGGVYPRSVFFRNEVRVPLPFLELHSSGRTAVTDAGGWFPYRGGSVRAGLDGVNFEMNCVNCTAPADASVQAALGIGRLDFGIGGVDEQGNGVSSPAERNTFFHLTQVRRIALKWLPGLAWLRDHHLEVNVNIDDTCNAFFDLNVPSLNFFRSGDYCNNTGEISDIVHHEWGHALDLATLVLDGGTSEGTADVMAMHVTHSSQIAPGFSVFGEPIRDLDASISDLGVITSDGIDSGDCDFPLGGISVHCVGQVYGQAAWDLAQSLAAGEGHHTGWRSSERLFFVSLPDAGTYRSDSALALYPAYLQADDDDGDLSNGTPHAAEIHEAFERHGIARDPLLSSAPCVRPEQPSVTVESVCGGFELSWARVEGAVGYEILRGELLEDSAYFSVANLSSRAVSYIDTEVADEVDYWYVVMAVAADGCESTVEDPEPARNAARPILSIDDVSVGDRLVGNRSGFPDPGEEIELQVTFANLGEVGVGAGNGIVRAATDGIAVVSRSLAWPALEAGQSAGSPDLLRLQVEPGTLCGDALRLEWIPEEDATGCAASEPSFFNVRVGQPDGAGGFVCDSTPPCFEPPAFSGIGLVLPGDSCGEVQLGWRPAKTHCENATMTYDVFRSESATFSPDAETRVASGVRGTTFVDRMLEPAHEYHYLVRAMDSRSGADDNAVVRDVFAPVSPDIVPPEFSGIGTLATGEACGEIELSWDAARETCSLPVSYEIYRSTEAEFVPGPATRIGSSLSPSYIDAALDPAATYRYVVRAKDAAGNETTQQLRGTAEARAFDLPLVYEPFENNDGGWRVIEPNDAWRGNWDWGNPEGTQLQPEDDATVLGAKCWMTGIKKIAADGSNNDVDFGTTTLLSTRYEIAGAVDPVLRYARWFTNDRGMNAADPRDAFRMHVSNDNGKTWHRLDWVGGGTPLEWVTVERPFGHLIEATDYVRFRIAAADIGQNILDVSLVEAGIDEFTIFDRNQGCKACGAPPGRVEAIRVDRDGDDVVLDWGDEFESGTRFAIYKIEGARHGRPVRIGTTTEPRFRHRGAAAAAESFSYRVASIDACATESDLR